MHEFPVKVTILIPSRITPQYGRDSTSAPYGTIVSVRLPNDEVKMIDRARQIIDKDISRISRGGFIRLAGYRAAVEICKHYDEYLLRNKEQTHERTDT